MAQIQFVKGIDEEVVPDVRLTRSKDGSNGRAMFYFDNPKIVQEGNLEITGMYLIDEEGELMTRDVSARFINGQPMAVEAVYSMLSAQEWDRFMRFMNRYAADNGLDFTEA